MPASEFEEFLAGDIPMPTFTHGFIPVDELDPPLPPTMPGAERLQWMKRYGEAFQSIKAANRKLAGSFHFYQRVLAKCVLKLYEARRELRSVKADLATANRELARVNDELRTAMWIFDGGGTVRGT
ncbi:hypothetical protein MMC32_005156 [Xylographa parallela]|nr:hypothetical protein [Xylographa parallela]